MLETEYEDVLVVEAGVELGLPLQASVSHFHSAPNYVWKATYHFGDTLEVVLVLEAEADDGGVKEGREEGAGARTAGDDAREVPQLDVDGGPVFGSDIHGLEVRDERSCGLYQVQSVCHPSQPAIEKGCTYRDERVAH